jgi:hypothetical protein
VADSYTTNLNLTKPEVGGSRDTWGTKVNGDMDSIDAVFAAAGTGTSVGLNVGAGKTLAVAGTINVTGTVSGGIIATLTGTQTLTNKTLTTPVVNGFTGDTSLVNIGSGQFYKATDGKIGFSTASPASILDVNGNVAQNIVAVAASAIDCSAGNFFTKTASGALTWTFTNVPASRAFAVILELTNGGTGTQTWPAAVKWPGGTAPTLTASGVDVLGFITDDGGTTWRGVALMIDSK